MSITELPPIGRSDGMRRQSRRISSAGGCEEFGVTGPGCRDEALLPPPTPASASVGGSSGSSSAFPRTSVGVHTMCNHGKGGENQDAYIASTSQGGTKTFVGVFDGHGKHGKRASEFVRTHIAKVLFSHKELHSDPSTALESAYLETQRQIEQNNCFDAVHSGTTAVAAYRHRDRLWVANVGDSRAVLGCCDSSATSEDPSHSAFGAPLRALDLSVDQRPAREDEKSRILAQGGSVHQSSICVRTGYGAAPRLIRVGPERVWDRSGVCGLGVARSLGDLGMRPFVTSQPEVHEHKLGHKDKLLVLGSDGVWDRLDSQEAIDIAARHKDPGSAAREITGVAKQRWHAETQGQLSDDITALVMHLDHGPTPPPTRSASTPLAKRSNTEPLPRGLAGSQRLAMVESLRPAGAPSRKSERRRR
mmetsp:Transcript_34777/g.99904  ORF Transcript_34777/g.99904 Transcript_34777/m.99904 type:complete len:419 (+) Transcript_34777:56-1312(+)